MGRGACASGDERSAATARDVLRDGGNAVDAFVACSLMACFTLPTMTGLGGAGIATIHADGETHVVDFFADVPGRGLAADDRPSPDVVIVPFEDLPQKFLVGPPSIAVPGTIAGLWAIHERWGSMPMSALAEPAIEAARGGVTVTAGQYRAFALLEEIWQRDPACWALLGDENGLVQIGDTLRNEELAATLEQLVEEGPPAFYAGDIAAAIVEASEGLVTREDLQAYEVRFRQPLRGRYRDHAILTPGAPSLSGAMLLTSLATLEGGGPVPARIDTRTWHRIADAIAAGERLRSEEFEARLFEDGYLERLVASGPAGATMHASVIDDDGGVVACTTTVGESAGLVAGTSGVALNNFLGELDIAPEGRVHDAGARMMTSMAPTLLRSPAGRWLALGSAGSSRIRSAILQVLVHVVDRGDHLPQAIGRPRVHAEQGVLYVEGYGRSKEEVEALRRPDMALEATWAPGFYFGGVQAVAGGDGTFEAGAEEVRRGGAAYVV